MEDRAPSIDKAPRVISSAVFTAARLPSAIGSTSQPPFCRPFNFICSESIIAYWRARNYTGKSHLTKANNGSERTLANRESLFSRDFVISCSSVMLPMINMPLLIYPSRPISLDMSLFPIGIFLRVPRILESGKKLSFTEQYCNVYCDGTFNITDISFLEIYMKFESSFLLNNSRRANLQKILLR